METKTLKAFHVAIGNYGHTLRMILTFNDDSQENVDFGAELAPQMVQALIQIADVAEKARNVQPGSSVSIENPWFATNVRTGTGADGQIAIGFSTKQGPPIQIAMPRSLAETTIRRIKAELQKPIPRTS